MSDRSSSRRTFLKTTGIVAAAGLCSTVPASAAEVSNAPVPDNAGEKTYATMGTDVDNPTAKLYGNFKCPYTQEFVRGGNLEAVLNEYVTSGNLNVEFHALAYQPPGTSSHGTSTYYISDSDPLISEAAMGVWDVSPGDYWDFFNYMFSDIISGNVSFSEMKERMAAANVDNRDTIIDRANSDRFSDEVEQNRYSGGDYGVSFTPTLVLDGETIAPHHETDELLNWIGSRIDTSSDAGTSNGSSNDEANSSQDSSNDADSNSGDTSSDSGQSSSSSDSGNTDSTSDGSTSDGSTSDESTSDGSTSNSNSSGSTSNSNSSGSTSDSDSSSADSADSADSSSDESDESDTSADQSSDDSASPTDDSGSEISIGKFCRAVFDWE